MTDTTLDGRHTLCKTLITQQYQASTIDRWSTTSHSSPLSSVNHWQMENISFITFIKRQPLTDGEHLIHHLYQASTIDRLSISPHSSPISSVNHWQRTTSHSSPISSVNHWQMENNISFITYIKCQPLTDGEHLIHHLYQVSTIDRWSTSSHPSPISSVNHWQMEYIISSITYIKRQPLTDGVHDLIHHLYQTSTIDRWSTSSHSSPISNVNHWQVEYIISFITSVYETSPEHSLDLLTFKQISAVTKRLVFWDNCCGLMPLATDTCM